MREIRLTIETRDGGNRGAWVLRERHDLGLPNGQPSEADLGWLDSWIESVAVTARRWANMPSPARHGDPQDGRPAEDPFRGRADVKAWRGGMHAVHCRDDRCGAAPFEGPAPRCDCPCHEGGVTQPTASTE